jgi:alginate O-acetyltransferase complex protein AlgI
MLFNSIEFISFFVLVFFIYWSLAKQAQNRFLLLASYFFYGCWNWKFLSLILLSTVVDYYCGHKIHESSEPTKRRRFLLVSLGLNLGVLALFKYANFFVAETVELLNAIGFSAHHRTWQIILPVGISFYTFQTLSYTIDIFRGKLEPVHDKFDFALFVTFFPQLVAGPIERATHLLPQITNSRKFDYEEVMRGLYTILWGLFIKVVIADTVAIHVDTAFSNPSTYSGRGLLLASYLFAVQIYCDFYGYSIIAKGVGKTLGFRISDNFNLPYISRTPVEFWERWHISLSQWFRDYLYFPLAMHYMRKGQGVISQYKAHLVSMALIGLWHGANWTFLIFGIYWGLVIIAYYIGLDIKDRLTDWLKLSESGSSNKLSQWALTMIQTVLMFHLVVVGWILFRADSIGDALTIFSHILTSEPGSPINLSAFIYTVPLVVVELYSIARKRLEFWEGWPRVVCMTYALGATFGMVLLGTFENRAFIYFQF